ncbi:DNA alkylation repair protein [Marinomonas sp. 5E14-1]|uniref:DNA alkylation repair protein n=1 Tax=Marinomonas sp. 5E14-1 TaxID=3153922 RepID=UPI003266765F
MEAFKDKLSMSLVRLFAFHLSKQLPSEPNFNEEAFCRTIEAKLDSLELKQRAQLIADEMHKVLPVELNLRYSILRRMLHTRPHANLKVSQQSDEEGLCGWAMMPLGMVVAQHGLENFELSLNLLKDMTSYFSSEFDIRPFIIADQQRALAITSSWVYDDDYHVRRLVSEGTRPRLPWAMQLPNLIKDPSPLIPLLTVLRDDEEEYVRRSVANHLNDIAKDHPDKVASIAKDWLQAEAQPINKDQQKNRLRLVKHACRTLIKQGHPEALAAFGIHPAQVTLNALNTLTSSVCIGDDITFELIIASSAEHEQTLIIDYLVHHKKANGSLTAKVFKWKSVTLSPSETLTIQKTHPFKVITTRQYYSGTHAVSVRINGADYGYCEFELVKPCP